MTNDNEITFIESSNPVNNFDDIIGYYQQKPVPIGFILNYIWHPSFKTRNSFLSIRSQALKQALSLCSDELLIKTYCESLCLISLIRNKHIKSFPESFKIVEKEFSSLTILDNTFDDILKNNETSFYLYHQFSPKYFSNPKFNHFPLNKILQEIISRDLQQRVQLNLEDFSTIFYSKDILSFPSSFFLHLPVNGDTHEGLNYYVSEIDYYLNNFDSLYTSEEYNKKYIDLDYIFHYFNNFKTIWDFLKSSKNENLKNYAQNYLISCNNFINNNPHLINKKNSSFFQDINNFKKEKTHFSYSILESLVQNLDVPFYTLKNTTICLDGLSIIGYQRDKHKKHIELKHIKTSIDKIFSSLDNVLVSFDRNIIYILFKNSYDIDDKIFEKTVQKLTKEILLLPLSPKTNFQNEYQSLIEKAIMETDLLLSDTPKQSTTSIRKF